jgi:beta-barrel assembly-enhancing protease
MEQTFQGRFYNGLSSRALDAVVALEENTILIAYTDKEGESQTVAWDIAQMKKNEFIAKDKVTLLYGAFPPQSLEINSAEFIHALKTKYTQKEFMKSHYHFLANKGWKGVIIGGSLCVSIILLFYFFGIPTIAENIAEKFPIEYEKQIGEQLFDVLTREYVKDSSKTALVNEFFQELGYPSKYDAEITVVDYSMVNAFAVPGGNIVVFSGILDKMQNSNELAALLAHELSHIELKHSTKSIFRSLANYMFISLIFYDVNAIASILLENVDMLTNLHYSRTLEQEADEHGLAMMLDRKIDPKGMIQLFETLKQDIKEVQNKISNLGTESVENNEEKKYEENIANEADTSALSTNEYKTDDAKNEPTKTKDSEEADEPTEFMSTHPLLSNRIEFVKNKIANQKYQVKENEKLKTLWEKIKLENQ